MFTSNFIRRHIYNLPLEQLFTTRDMLSYGKRAAVDQELCRLVKRGIIIRLVRGVFIREGSKKPSIWCIAKAKVESFGKTMIKYGADIANELGLELQRNSHITFAINGCSSSFRYGDLVIHLKSTGPRKIRLGDTKAGQAIRALWHNGKKNFQTQQIEIVTLGLRFLRQDHAELNKSGNWTPAWLNTHLVRS